MNRAASWLAGNHNELRFELGDVVRLYDRWGVVVVGQLPPEVLWLQDDNGWIRRVWFQSEISKFDHTYEGIPDPVLAKATEIKLKGGS